MLKSVISIITKSSTWSTKPVRLISLKQSTQAEQLQLAMEFFTLERHKLNAGQKVAASRTGPRGRFMLENSAAEGNGNLPRPHNDGDFVRF